MRVEDIT